MSCMACASGNQAEFPAQILLHFYSSKNLHDTGVRLSPKLFVCLDCGFARFYAPKTELVLLAVDTPTSDRTTGEAHVDDVSPPPEIALLPL